ncbi:hypothetical protein Tco_0156264 [Tanacetum coccineum]
MISIHRSPQRLSQQPSDPQLEYAPTTYQHKQPPKGDTLLKLARTNKENNTSGASGDKLLTEEEIAFWQIQDSLMFQNSHQIALMANLSRNVQMHSLRASDVQKVFYQMEQAVEQHRLESKTFEVKMNQVLGENERLLEQAIDKDIVKTVVNLSMNANGGNVTEMHKEQGLVIAALKNELRKLKGKALDNKETVTHSVDPNMDKDNMEPITPKLLNKRTAHSSYIKHTQEEALVLRDIVEHVKANYPQDPLLESAFRYTKVIQDLLSHISRSCPSINIAGPSSN